MGKEQICSLLQLDYVFFVSQVYVPFTQNRYQGTLMSADPTQGPKVSQVTLPCDSQGSINFTNYPFRVSI